MKEAALISPRWKWQNDSSTTLIKKISILKNNSIELEEFIAEIYQTKKDDLRVFNITEWKVLKKNKINSHYVNSGTYLARDKSFIFWSEIYFQDKTKLFQCLITSPREIGQEQINEGVNLCRE
jgi:hypothetical protein